VRISALHATISLQTQLGTLSLLRGTLRSRNGFRELSAAQLVSQTFQRIRITHRAFWFTLTRH
jgi:hypothetical protein